MPTPGIADPYWYEWFVGLKNVIEMLNPDSGISSVTFQCSQYATIDDVVVEYQDGKQQFCYQVKHEIATSAANNLTFGKMLESSNGRPCLFSALFYGWKDAVARGFDIKPVLYTNRKILNRRAGRRINGESYSAYPVDRFVEYIKETLTENPDYNAFKLDDTDMASQWTELCVTLGNPEKASLLKFISVFSIEANQISLAGMETLLIDMLAQCFQCSNSIASELFTKLLRGLRTWTTSERSCEKVSVEDVLSVLGVEEDYDAPLHRLAPPSPFFESRKEFCDLLLQQLQETDKKLVFISGDPGSGKTSTISYLQSTANIFYLRYHTFRPISPEQRFYDSDHGLCTIEKLWGTLLIQLRQRFLGRLNELDVPVSNKLLSKESLRKNVLRLLGIAAQEAAANGNKLFVCIDGIDHAARAKNQLSFLPSLPTPAEIPDGIRFVVVGQPITLYPDQYPNWMANNQDILYINMPKLRKEDIEQLIIERIPWFATESKNIAIAIHEKTAGNNLSAAFVVEEIKNTASLDEVYQTLRAPHISDNVNQYYDHIWSHLKEALGQIMVNRVYPESFIACPLLLLNGRVNTRILSQALQLGLSKTDWTLLLKRLHPLVIPTDTPDEYALFHNDFRVYLQSIVYQYTERYEEIAYTLAKYLLENDEGLISYVLGIQLLKHANKAEDIPKYFNTSFVINALAEGVSYARLDAFAHDAYHVACKKRDFDGYCNVYLAIKTLYQHYSYYEYFGREYLCLDFPEIEQMDINEIRSLPITKDNLDEYEVVLSLCQKLYTSKRHDGQARAMNLYNMWFAKYTPLSFLALIRDELENEEFSLKGTNVGILLQHWGQLAATIRIPVKHFETDDSFIENYAVTLWGNEYFSRCIEDKQYDLAIASVHAGVVNRHCFAEKMEHLLYTRTAEKFQEIFPKLSLNEEEPAEYLLALAIQTILNKSFIPEASSINIDTKSKYIYDQSCFELVLKGFLLGKLDESLHDDALIQKADSICAFLEENDGTAKQQAIHLVRTAALLGKHFWNTDTASVRFQGYAIWFLSAKMYRSFDCSKACHFILYTLLHSKPAQLLATQEDFLDALRMQLFESSLLGMFYKTHVLDYLIQHNVFDTVRDYIIALYGEKYENINATDNKLDIHTRFEPYGMTVEPAMMREFSAKLKWDVVGYLGYDEYAMYSPLELFELMIQNNPTTWKTFASELYHQSAIADKSSNKASHQIRRTISEASACSSLADYWELRTWDDAFQLNPDFIVHAILGMINNATSSDDLTSLWLLGCGISSWYTSDGHQQARQIYEACINRSTQLEIDIVSSIEKLTPQWMAIIHNRKDSEYVRDDSAAYYSKREADIATITAMFAEETFVDILDRLPTKDVYTNDQIGYPLDYYEIALSKIAHEKNQTTEAYRALLSKLCLYLKEHEWSRDKYDVIIRKLLEFLPDEAFWQFAVCLEETLPDYHYQTACRNIQLLLKLYAQKENAVLAKLFTDELSSHRLWITGNNHFSISQHTQLSIEHIKYPASLPEACLSILLEQINSQNARKIESALYSVTLLGKLFSTIMESMADAWDSYTQLQKEYLLYPIMRWAIEGCCSKKLGLTLKNSYDKCCELSMKLRLHSVLLHLNYPDIQTDILSCVADAQIHLLPTSGVELTECYYNRFISLISKEIPQDTIQSIRRYLMNATPLETYYNDPFADSSDSRLPLINREPGEIFYQFEKDKLLSAIPLTSKKSWLLSSDDSFVITSMPAIDFSDSLFPSLPNEHEPMSKIKFSTGMLSAIVQKDISLHETVVAACLWLPWGQKDGLVFNQATKVGYVWAMKDNDFDWNLGDFSALVYEGMPSETHYSTGGNLSLFNKVGGRPTVYFGNCQVVPSAAWKRLLNCRPQDDNPLVWLNEYGVPVLRFEHILCPNRMLMQQPYIRQPILFRWICNKSWLDTALQKLDLRSYLITETEPYPSMGSE